LKQGSQGDLLLATLDVDGELVEERKQLSSEAKELMNIFGAILRKCE
jgi:hypothetical protein